MTEHFQCVHLLAHAYHPHPFAQLCCIAEIRLEITHPAEQLHQNSPGQPLRNLLSLS
jgi:hypothetical protein